MKIKHNMSYADRYIRLALAVIIFGLGFYYHTWWGLVGLFPLITAIIRWCPGYALLGIKTCKVCD